MHRHQSLPHRPVRLMELPPWSQDILSPQDLSRPLPSEVKFLKFLRQIKARLVSAVQEDVQVHGV